MPNGGSNRNSPPPGPSGPPFPKDTGVLIPVLRSHPPFSLFWGVCLSQVPRLTAVITDLSGNSLTMVMLKGKQEHVDGTGGRLGDSSWWTLIHLTADEELGRWEIRRGKEPDAEALGVGLETRQSPRESSELLSLDSLIKDSWAIIVHGPATVVTLRRPQSYIYSGPSLCLASPNLGHIYGGVSITAPDLGTDLLGSHHQWCDCPCTALMPRGTSAQEC